MFGVRTFLGIITYTSVEKPELKNANHFVLVGVGKGGGGGMFLTESAETGAQNCESFLFVNSWVWLEI